MIGLLVVAGVSAAAWLVLMVARGGYWRVSPVLQASDAAPEGAGPEPSVLAIIPARNEVDVLTETLPTVLRQRTRGAFRVLVVDDNSDDGTAAVAREVAAGCGAADRLSVVDGKPLPPGWAGKVWAMNQGAERGDDSIEYLWLTDADIAHDSRVLQALVDTARSNSLDLVSVMARLRIEGRWDALLIPAFVYFFAKLYPFRFVRNPRRRTAGAAGGCILVRRAALEAAGGLRALRSALIDDCALGALVKRSGGRTWLGFSSRVTSVRSYRSLRSIWDMVARSAFHQLHYSAGLLVGTVVGMLLLYAVPPVASAVGLVAAIRGVSGGVELAVLGFATWITLALSFVPILRHQQSCPCWAPLLPVAGGLYTAMTLSSALRYWAGRGGVWKGRPFRGG